MSAPVGWPHDLPDLVPVQAMTKTELAYVRIRQQILQGELAPGQPLDQETLAASLGLSTTPVREALRRLESEHLVVNQAHRDTVVAPLSFRMLEEVYSVRLSLDPLAAAAAASVATPEERELMQALTETALDQGDEVAHLHLNRRLHRAIYGASGNSVLVQLLDQLWDMSDRYRLITLKDNAVIKSAKEEHAEIVRAVREDKPKLASRLMHEHVADSLARIRTSSGIAD